MANKQQRTFLLYLTPFLLSDHKASRLYEEWCMCLCVCVCVSVCVCVCVYIHVRSNFVLCGSRFLYL